MNLRVLSVLILLCSPVYNAASANHQATASRSPQKTTDKSYDVASFAAELHRLDLALQKNPSADEIMEVRKTLPESWNISTPEQMYSISTKPFVAQLDVPSVEGAEEWIEHLEREIEGSQTRTATSASTARSELDHILGGPEFAAVRPPGPIQLFRERLGAWLGNLLLKLFGGIVRHPIGAEILFWLLLTCGVAFVALWVFRYLSTRDRLDALRPESSIASARTWQEWLRTARQAANRGDFREAVHSAYWAGIARLEDMGAVPRDRTKTPREYLFIVSESLSGDPSQQRDRKQPLTALTSRLERIWYANRGATVEDFRDSLHQLEALGCPLELQPPTTNS